MPLNSVWSEAVFDKKKFKWLKTLYPQWRPITSRMNVLWWEDAVDTIASMDSLILCRAESAPTVMSAPEKSLSMEPTMPTIRNSLNLTTSSFVISPENQHKKKWCINIYTVASWSASGCLICITDDTSPCPVQLYISITNFICFNSFSSLHTLFIIFSIFTQMPKLLPNTPAHRLHTKPSNKIN